MKNRGNKKTLRKKYIIGGVFNGPGVNMPPPGKNMTQSSTNMGHPGANMPPVKNMGHPGVSMPPGKNMGFLGTPNFWDDLYSGGNYKRKTRRNKKRKSKRRK